MAAPRTPQEYTVLPRVLLSGSEHEALATAWGQHGLQSHVPNAAVLQGLVEHVTSARSSLQRAPVLVTMAMATATGGRAAYEDVVALIEKLKAYYVREEVLTRNPFGTHHTPAQTGRAASTPFRPRPPAAARRPMSAAQRRSAEREQRIEALAQRDPAAAAVEADAAAFFPDSSDAASEDDIELDFGSDLEEQARMAQAKKQRKHRGWAAVRLAVRFGFKMKAAGAERQRHEQEEEARRAEEEERHRIIAAIALTRPPPPPDDDEATQRRIARLRRSVSGAAFAPMLRRPSTAPPKRNVAPEAAVEAGAAVGRIHRPSPTASVASPRSETSAFGSASTSRRHSIATRPTSARRPASAVVRSGTISTATTPFAPSAPRPQSAGITRPMSAKTAAPTSPSYAALALSPSSPSIPPQPRFDDVTSPKSISIAAKLNQSIGQRRATAKAEAAADKLRRPPLPHPAMLTAVSRTARDGADDGNMELVTDALVPYSRQRRPSRFAASMNMAVSARRPYSATVPKPPLNRPIDPQGDRF